MAEDTGNIEGGNQESLAEKVRKCIEWGGPDKSKQFLDVPQIVCPFSLYFEIEGSVARKPGGVQCPHVSAHELHTNRESDQKTMWHYRACYIKFESQDS